MEFVQKLGTIIVDEAYDEIIYLDETTVHLQMKLPKCWLTPGMKLTMIKERGPSITIIGAISDQRGLIHVKIFKENNNAINFQEFLIGLKHRCKGK